MNQNELVQKIAARTHGLTQDQVKAVLGGFHDELSIMRAGEEIRLSFGKFSAKTRAARQGVNLQTGAAMHIPERVALTFKPSKPIADSIK